MLLLFSRAGLEEVAGAFGVASEVSSRAVVVGELVVKRDEVLGELRTYSVAPRSWYTDDLSIMVEPPTYDCGEGLRLLMKAVESVPDLEAALVTSIPSVRVSPHGYTLYNCVEERGLERCVPAAWLGPEAPDFLYQLLSSPPIYYIDAFERPDPCVGRRCIRWKAGTLVLLGDCIDISDVLGRR